MQKQKKCLSIYFGQLDLQFNLLTEILTNVTQFNELMSLLQLSSHDMYICYQASTDGDKGEAIIVIV